jgi:hypothetical protein
LKIINLKRLVRKKNSRNLESNPNLIAKTPLVQKWVSVKRLPVDHTKTAISNFGIQKFCIKFVGIK